MEYRGLRLDPFQQQAIEFIEDGRSVLVAAPTGTGKTLIADFLIEETLKQGGEVIYTAPIKALSNQKYRQYSAYFGRENVGLITGDLVINREAPVRIMTTEILRNILLEGHRLDEEGQDIGVQARAIDDFSPSELVSPRLGRLRAVIIDEIHFLDDPDRGTVWEELLIYLPSQVRILGLSATLSNLEEFAEWLTQIRSAPVEVVLETKRAVPLTISLANKDVGMVDRKKYEREYRRFQKSKKREQREEGRRGRRGRGRGEDRDGSTNHLHIIEMLPKSELPALYFIYSRKMVEVLATRLARSRIGKGLNDPEERRRLEERLRVFEREFPKVLTGRLYGMYRQGIAFHHAGLHVALKALVEELYEARLLRILYCTSTFALGINMPARTVIFDSLTKFDGTDFVPLTTREFMQIAGRAGRRGIDETGTVVIRQDFQNYHEVRGLLQKLMGGESEPVVSAFNLSFHSVVNLLERFDEEEIRFMLGQSFKAFQDARSAKAARREVKELEAVPEEERNRGHRRHLAALRRDITLLERPRLWESFSRKVSFLKSYGYLAGDNQLNGPAKILRHIKIEEIFVTELLVRGVLEDRTPEELFGIMVGLVQDLPRSAKVFLPREEKWFSIFDELTEVFESPIVVGAAELMEAEATFTPELMPLGERWARGESLAAILEDIRNPTDLSGDLVGGFRRAKDLVSQIRQVHSEDQPRFEALTQVLRKVTRDEVQVLD